MPASDTEAEIAVSVIIDEVQCRVPAGEIAGRDLRQVPDATIGDDRDLWVEVPGEPDELVEDERIVVIEEDMRFFSVSRHITPG